MIYRNEDRQVAFQNYRLWYAFLSFKNYSQLSVPLKDTGLGYSPIGPTSLVEWQDD